jgi:thioredoxin-like negative regulator of GroEL
VQCAPVDDFYAARLGAAYARQSRLEQAQAGLVRATMLAPDNPVYRYALADIMLLQDNAEAAERLIEAVGPLDEYHSDGLRRWRLRAGLMPLSEVGLLPASHLEVAALDDDDDRFEDE